MNKFNNRSCGPVYNEQYNTSKALFVMSSIKLYFRYNLFLLVHNLFSFALKFQKRRMVLICCINNFFSLYHPGRHKWTFILPQQTRDCTVCGLSFLKTDFNHWFYGINLNNNRKNLPTITLQRDLFSFQKKSKIKVKTKKWAQLLCGLILHYFISCYIFYSKLYV